MVLPGTQKSLDQFAQDENYCDRYAQGRIGQTTPGKTITSSTAQGGLGGAAIGAAGGSLLGAAAGSPATGAAIGAGGGLLAGSAAGSNMGGSSADMLQMRYDMSYIQCMYAKGNQVPVPASYGGLSARQTPPPPPPGRTPLPDNAYTPLTPKSAPAPSN
jgi:outer membrane lipoprotein SlyB